MSKKIRCEKDIVVLQTDQSLQCYVARLEVHGLNASGWNYVLEVWKYVFSD